MCKNRFINILLAVNNLDVILNMQSNEMEQFINPYSYLDSRVLNCGIYTFILFSYKQYFSIGIRLLK